MCNHDCFNCQYDDCIEEALTVDEIKASKELDADASQKPIDHKTAVKREVQRRYWNRHRNEIRERRKANYDKVKAANNERSRKYNSEHREELNEYGKANYRRKKAERVS